MSAALAFLCALALFGRTSAQMVTPMALLESAAPQAAMAEPQVSPELLLASPAAFAPTSATAFAPTSATACFQGCRMRPCNGPSSYPLGALTDTPFTGPICSKSAPYVGTVLDVGEAYVHEAANQVIPISHFSPAAGVSYQRETFGVYTFHNYNSVYNSKSGIGRGYMSPAQLAGLEGRCVVIPITHYVPVGRRGIYKAAAVSSANSFVDCFAFFIEPAAAPLAAPVPTRTPTPVETIVI